MGDLTMKKLHNSILLSLIVLFSLFGCAPPTTGSKGNITINVTQPAAKSWAYAITTTGSNITKIVFNLTVSGCKVVKMPQGWKSGAVNGGVQVEEATGALAVNVTLECDANDGPIYVYVYILDGLANFVGPISGPV